MMKTDIGINAGTIWQLLSHKGELSVEELKTITERDETQILLALGWLSREDKIRITAKEGLLYAELNQFIAETYY